MLQSFNVEGFSVKGFLPQYKRGFNPSMLKGFAFNIKGAQSFNVEGFWPSM
jgi:hypothetical protein